MAPKDIARSYPKRGLTADVGFRSEPKFCGDGSTEFDGAADFVNASNYTKGSSTATAVSFWMKSEKDLNNAITVCNNQGGGSNSVDQFIVRFFSNSLDVQFDDGSQRSVNLTTTSAGNFSINAWHHVLFVIDGSSATFTCKAFFDGIKQDAITSGGYTTGTGLNIGARASSFYFDGKIADFRIYDVVLTDAQCLEVYNNPSNPLPSGVSSSNLRRRYLLATDFNDTGADSQNGTATGSPSFTVDRPQLPRGLDLARGAAQARVYTGRAVDFDGSTDFLDMGTGVDKNYTTRSDRASFSCWFNADQIAASAWIYQNRTQLGATSRSECETQLFTHPSLGLAFDGDFASILIPLTDFNVGQWHHFVGIADDSDGPVKAYLDGVLYDTTSIPQAGANGNNFVIGARNNSPLQPFNGRISNFKIFNVELTQAQVRELYHNPEMVIPTGVSASNLRRHYPLCAYNDTGGMGGRYETDQGVEGVNGEYGGSPVMAFAQPVPCPQLGLQQSASRIHWSDNTGQKLSGTIPALGTDFTIALWFQRGSTTSAETFLEVNTPGTYQFYYDLTQLVYYGSSSGVFYTGVSCAEGEWVHIGLTQNGVYKNGVLYTTTFSLDWLGTAYRMFGRHSASNSCSGLSSSMAFWSDALTTAEMLELYNQGPDYDPRNDTGNYASSDTLQNLWFMDDLATVKDRKGSNDLTVIGSPIMQSFPENASGSTIVGDFSMKRKGVSVLNLGAVSSGANEYALSAKDSAFLPNFANGGAFSCFFRLQKLGEYSAIFINDDYGSGIQHRFAVFVDTANKLRVEIGDGASARANPVSTGAISDSDWHHFAFTIDYGGGSTTTIKLFLDGVLDSTSTATTLAGIPNATALRFGDYVTSGTNEMNGPVACLKFYQVTLSDNEIKQIYNSDLRLIKGLDNE